MVRKARTIVVCILALCSGVLMLQGADRQHTFAKGEYIVAVVPFVGTGTPSDPRRPLLVPSRTEAQAEQAPVSFRFVPSDDGRRAIVVYSAPTQKALAAILNAAIEAGVPVFDPNKHALKDLHIAIKKVKANFDWGMLHGPGPGSPVLNTSNPAIGGSK